MPKFTKTYVDSLKVKDRPYEVWDTDLKGLGVKIHPSSRKTYYFLFRYKSSRKERLKVGVHGNITCEIAREIVRGWAGDLARGINTKDTNRRKEAEAKQTFLFSDFWKIFTDKYILEKHKPSTINKNKSRVQKDILPYFGSKIIADIERGDILAFKDSLSHVKGNCRKCLTLLSTAFDQAELWGYREQNSNPCKGVTKSPDKKMERFLTAIELEKLEQILGTMTFSQSSPYTVAAIWLLIYTGCRLSEVLELRWDGVHLDDGYLYLKDSKVGVRTIPLNDKAIQIFAHLQRQENNPYVFCGNVSGKPLVNIRGTWNKVRTLAGIPDVRIHDLRHSFASFALKKGVDLYTVSKLLGHKNIATTTRYAHLELEHLKAATNKVAGVFG
jgi:integrase